MINIIQKDYPVYKYYVLHGKKYIVLYPSRLIEQHFCIFKAWRIRTTLFSITLIYWSLS